jgi:hypothetical protein
VDFAQQWEGNSIMAKNLFAVALPSTARSSEYGYPKDHFDLPTATDDDEVSYPEFHGVADGVSEYRSNTGELFQTGNPEYAGQYELQYENDPGIAPTYTELVAAPGSSSLVAPRNAGEITGTNRLLKSDGPVDGTDGDRWTGDRAALHKPNPNYGGPVTGGPDYATQLHNAYFASVAAHYSQAASDSAMVAAV